VPSALNKDSTIKCIHDGKCDAVQPSRRVRICGSPALNLGTPLMVQGCKLPSNAGGPCVEGKFVSGCPRVRIEGVPAVTEPDAAVCKPTGAPALTAGTQQRVRFR